MKYLINLLFKKNGIYILPTKMGGYLNGLIFLLILLSVGYGNNLILIFTLFLFSFNLLWVVKSYLFSKELEITSLHFDDAYSGEKCYFSMSSNYESWDKEDRLILLTNRGKVLLEFSSFEDNTAKGNLIFHERGLYEIRKILYETSQPFGLYTTFKICDFIQDMLVYPELQRNIKIHNPFSTKPDGEILLSTNGSEDFSEIVKSNGENAKTIDWRVYAKRGEIYSKKREALSQDFYQIIWPEDFKQYDKELGLSILISEVKFLYEHKLPFELRIENKKFTVENNFRMYQLCRREIALC